VVGKQVPPTTIGSGLSVRIYRILVTGGANAEKWGILRDRFGPFFDRFLAIVEVPVTVLGLFLSVFDLGVTEVFEFCRSQKWKPGRGLGPTLRVSV
jgi:hypothetical protein